MIKMEIAAVQSEIREDSLEKKKLQVFSYDSCGSGGHKSLP